ncbi:pseudouridine synthase [Sphingomonas sp. MA1305]|uniref:pseudouridine synthase n=1 Tax=Sphingomonas sp. MA1305 TaxID=2479204 RepID=UPI001E6593EE|nr:pseudouridine synthase [Sphingomonas sp. MA1305]
MAPTSGSSRGDRIAKLLARAGIASRREVERMIAGGRVARDGVVIDTPATVLTSLKGITVDGNPVATPEPTRLFLFHKPTGLLVTERDPRGRPTIYERLPHDLPRLVPVGRLDLNTEGLLLLTTDGGFKRQLELPATGVERTYRVRAYGNITQAQLEDLADGIEIEGVRYGSIDANIERRTGANVWIEMTLTEGKNREVRRVLEHLGLQVGRLIRIRYGPFVLGDLPVGEVGEVKQHELVAFRRTLNGGVPDESFVTVSAEPRPGFRSAPTVDRAARSRARSDGAARPTAASGTTRPQPTRATSPRDGQAGRTRTQLPRDGSERPRFSRASGDDRTRPAKANAASERTRPARSGAEGERNRPARAEAAGDRRAARPGTGEQRGRPSRPGDGPRSPRPGGNRPRSGSPGSGSPIGGGPRRPRGGKA